VILPCWQPVGWVEPKARSRASSTSYGGTHLLQSVAWDGLRIARRKTRVNALVLNPSHGTSLVVARRRPVGQIARMLVIDDVTLRVAGKLLLEGASARIPDGARVGLVGRNGVGKTTLLATVMGHTILHCGNVVLDGRSLNGMPCYRRALAGLGLVPQEREIFPSLTVRENLDVGARPGYWTSSRVFDLFPRLEERLGNLGHQLSGGEQQMLSIARALLTNPTVLLMDEPTEGLAPLLVEALTAVLTRLRAESGLSMILVEQNSRVALAFSRRTVILDKGRIVYDGASEPLRGDADRLAQLIGLVE
jgi:branched-chain amino acid transport system ATP-binding protein